VPASPRPRQHAASARREALDTVLLWPNETIWLAGVFALPEDAAFRGAQRYMSHCHNLEHEDAMMTRNFTVV
jgi:FtsP/CotA-like multicopper oxidase with cupredoxin domain